MASSPALDAALRWLCPDANVVMYHLDNGWEPSPLASDALVADMRLIAAALAQPEAVQHCAGCCGRKLVRMPNGSIESAIFDCPGLPVAQGVEVEAVQRVVEAATLVVRQNETTRTVHGLYPLIRNLQESLADLRAAHDTGREGKEG
jgi:hypothetical protein